MNSPVGTYDLQASHEIILLLEKAKTNIESTVDRLPDLFCIIDKNGVICRGNSVLAKLLNIEQEAVLNRNISELFSDMSKSIFFGNLSRFSGTTDSFEKQMEFELPVDLSTGRSLTLFWNIQMLERLPSDKGSLFYVIGRDISVSVLLENKNKQLELQKNKIQSILDSAAQGFCTVNRSYQIEPEYSINAEKMLGKDIAGKNICEVLKMDPGLFSKLAQALFAGGKWALLRTVSVLETSIENHQIKVELSPINSGNEVTLILVTLTDVTQIRQMEKRMEQTNQRNRTIVKILQAKPLFSDIVENLALSKHVQHDDVAAKRLVHTLKGVFGFFEFQEAIDLCQNWEKTERSFGYANDVLELIEKIEKSVKEFIIQFDSILNFSDLSKTCVTVELSQFKPLYPKNEKELTVQYLSDRIDSLLEKPPQEYFGWLNDAWLTTASRLKKKVLAIEWVQSAPIFPQPYKRLLASLIHAIRNAADHGIELPEDRIAAGKPSHGRLIASLELNEGVYNLTLKDDGRGINLEKIREAAQKRGLLISDLKDNLTDLLFFSNFSTKGTISEISGLGIGLNALKAEAENLDGGISISNPNTGGVELKIWFKRISFRDFFTKPDLGSK